MTAPATDRRTRVGGDPVTVLVLLGDAFDSADRRLTSHNRRAVVRKARSGQ